MSVKLKFRVDSKSEQLQSVRNADGSGYTNKRIGSVKLLPVTGGSSDNEQFYQWKAGRMKWRALFSEKQSPKKQVSVSIAVQKGNNWRDRGTLILRPDEFPEFARALVASGIQVVRRNPKTVVVGR